MKMQAVLNGIVVAESDRTVIVEGNHYFPADDVDADYLQPSATHTTSVASSAYGVIPSPLGDPERDTARTRCIAATA